MAILPIKQVPNQSISTIVEGVSYDLAIKTIANITYASISVGDELKVQNIKCNINQPIMPFKYMHPDAGNFIFTSVDDAYPSYENFNVSTQLQYISIAGEIL